MLLSHLKGKVKERKALFFNIRATISDFCIVFTPSADPRNAISFRSCWLSGGACSSNPRNLIPLTTSQTSLCLHAKRSLESSHPFLRSGFQNGSEPTLDRLILAVGALSRRVLSSKASTWATRDGYRALVSELCSPMLMKVIFEVAHAQELSFGFMMAWHRSEPSQYRASSLDCSGIDPLKRRLIAHRNICKAMSEDEPRIIHKQAKYGIIKVPSAGIRQRAHPKRRL